jgi:hypothetical protein
MHFHAALLLFHVEPLPHVHMYEWPVVAAGALGVALALRWVVGRKL